MLPHFPTEAGSAVHDTHSHTYSPSPTRRLLMTKMVFTVEFRPTHISSSNPGMKVGFEEAVRDQSKYKLLGNGKIYDKANVS